MAAEKYLSTQASILIAGALIAGALYFGLRGREPAPPPAPAVSTGAATLGSAAAVSAPGAPPAPTAREPAPAATPTADREAATAAVSKALELQRAAVVKKCVEPALAKKPDPPRVKLRFNITFGPDGKQVMRGVSDDRETYREGVSTCAMDAIPDLQIPAQGVSVYVEIPWTLP